MSDVSKPTEVGDAGQATGLPPIRLSKQKSLAVYQQELMLARLKLAQAKKRLQLESVRDTGRRERATGKVVLLMIAEGKLDGRTVALIRDEVRASCRSPMLVAAFRGSILD